MRETNMDGSLHIEGDCCSHTRCYRLRDGRNCEGVRHFQGIYGGYMEACEVCPQDVEHWEPEGTYCRDCECSKVQCAERNCSWKM